MTDRRILVDWVCYGAETDWWACYRPWSTRAMSWATWHVARFDATGDPEELVRAGRHIEPLHDSGPVSQGSGGQETGPHSSGG